MRKILFIVGNSYDTTLDLLLATLNLPSDSLFRLNYDLLSMYSVVLEPNYFRIVDPTGRVVDSHSVAKVYWRKPHRPQVRTAEEEYTDNENWYAIRSMVRQLWRSRRVVLVEPFAEASRLDKFTQLHFASRYFRIPKTIFIANDSILPEQANVIVKSLSGGRIGTQAVYASRVDYSELCRNFPWLTQEWISADFDLTVVFVRGKQYHFILDRTPITAAGLSDWKEGRTNHSLEAWENVEPDGATFEQVSRLMKDFNLDYGRLDFLHSNGSLPTFLEVNPNGQFAWLDLRDDTGLIAQICSEIDPRNCVNPIPYNPYLEEVEARVELAISKTRNI